MKCKMTLKVAFHLYAILSDYVLLGVFNPLRHDESQALQHEPNPDADG